MRQQALLAAAVGALVLVLIGASILTAPSFPPPDSGVPEVISVQKPAVVMALQDVQSEPVTSAAPTPIPEAWRIHAYMESDGPGGLVLWVVDPLKMNTDKYKIQRGTIRVSGMLEYAAVHLPYDIMGNPVWGKMLVLSQYNCPSVAFPSLDPGGCYTVLLGFAHGLDSPSIDGMWNGIYPAHRFNADGSVSKCVDADPGYNTNVTCTPESQPYPSP